MLTTNDFLLAVLPPNGNYCVVGLKKDEKPKQKFAGSIEDAEEIALKLVADEYDTYFALATFSNPSEGRTAKNANQFKTFFLDLDCGLGKPYADQSEGLTALKQFVKTLKLPKPTVVNSGRGVHAYWMLQSPIGKDVWKPLAEGLKALCEKHGLHADAAVTADTARILRVPGTYNYKNPATPLEVKVLMLGDISPLSNFQEVFKLVEDVFAGMTGQFVPRQLDPLTQALMGNSQSRFKTILIKSVEGSGCNQLLHIFENQDTIEEPLWRAGLSIAQHCVDREKGIHALSKKHPDYSESETEKKAAETRGPYTCITFRKLNPTACQGCTHNISSPIQLGREFAEASEKDNVIEVPETETAPARTIVIPKFPFPYKRGAVGGVYHVAKLKNEEDGTVQEVEELIYPYDFYVVKHMKDPDQGVVLLMRLHLPKDGVQEFIVPLSSVLAKDRFRDTIAMHGLAVLGKKQELLMAYITRWVEELQATNEAEIARRQFGWLPDDSAFILGDKEIRADEIKYSPPTATTLPLIPMFQEKGDFHIWKDVVSAYGNNGMEAKAFGMFMGFGNVLLKYTNLDGYLLSLKSQGSGSGKTTILHAIASIYGAPKASLMRVKDTYNQKLQRIGTFQHIPILLDEMTNMPPDQKSNMVYDITEGRGKNRLKSQENAERINLTSWATGMITTSNRSLRDDLLALKSFPEGELMRMMEMHIYNDPNDDPEWARAHFNRIHDNYGHAIFPFIQYIIARLPEVIELIASVQTRIERAANVTTQERYWSAMTAIAVVGGMIANKLNLIHIPVAPVQAYAVALIETSRKENKLMLLNNSDFLGSFLQRKFHETLVINDFVNPKTKLGEGPLREPRGALSIRYEPDTKLLFVLAKTYREECNRGLLNIEESLEMYKKSGAYLGTQRKRMAAGTIMGMDVNAPALVFDVRKLPDFKEEKFLNVDDSKLNDLDPVDGD
jgi:hypothetical protein